MGAHFMNGGVNDLTLQMAPVVPNDDLNQDTQRAHPEHFRGLGGRGTIRTGAVHIIFVGIDHNQCGPNLGGKELGNFRVARQITHPNRLEQIRKQASPCGSSGLACRASNYC